MHTKTCNIGFDEVGRGALAGPVTVGLVALPSDYPLIVGKYSPDQYRANTKFAEFKFVRDSKHLSPKQRLDAVTLLRNNQIKNITLSANNDLIDEFGISPCLRYLLLLGYNAFRETHPNEIFIDGRVYFPTSVDSKHESLIIRLISDNNLTLDHLVFPTPETQIRNEDKADDKYLAIALASCAAKVARDTYMTEQSQLFPVYNWNVNKGYGTEKHRKAIAQNFQNPLIRKTFIGNILKSKTAI